MSADEIKRIVDNDPERIIMLKAADLKVILEDTARKASSEASRLTAEYLQKETMISRAEAKKYLNVSNMTFSRWESKGVLKARSMVGNRYLYSLDEVKRLAGIRNAAVKG